MAMIAAGAVLGSMSRILRRILPPYARRSSGGVPMKERTIVFVLGGPGAGKGNTKAGGGAHVARRGGEVGGAGC